MKNFKGQIIDKCPLMAEVELIYKSKTKKEDRPLCTRSSDIYDYLLSVWNHNKIDFIEEMLVVCFNGGNQIIGWAKISTGSSRAVICDPKLVFQIALLHNASFIALAHNHPSGNHRPSDADKAITRRIKSAGDTLGIELLDHLIITDNSYYSFSDEGII